MKSSMLGVLLLLTPTLLAQQSVPEIPFDSVPNFLKLPADMYLGEASGVAVNSKGHVFVFSRGNTTGPLMEPRPRNCSSSLLTVGSSARPATTCTPGLTRTRCASTRTTTSGP